MWPWSKGKRKSDKNGDILIRNGLNGPEVIVGGYQQTGMGLNDIWRVALQRAWPQVAPEPRVLIIGLGGGGMLGDVYKIFSGCRITAIEHDPTMIEITEELKYYVPFPLPDIICADALDGLRGLEERYDLIAIDIFKGGEPSPHLLSDEFWQVLKSRMSEKAILLVNVAGNRPYLEPVAKHFVHADMWRTEANYLGMFSD